MSIFKNHKTRADRSASDRSRHKKKIERAIREGIHDIVSDESIIGQEGKKKIKIPVRGIKEFRFVYGNNKTNKKVSAAPGKNIKKGQKVGNVKQKGAGGKPDRASDKSGEEFYEVEITLDELSAYLFDSLNLPDLERKKIKNILENKFKRSGYRNKGIKPRLSKKQTVKNKIKRRNIIKRIAKDEVLDDNERFPFHESDLKYKHIKQNPKENSNAVIFFMMDVSGSMTQDKKFIARSFFFLLYHFLRYRYDAIEIVFISHTVDAKEVNENDFFKVSTTGGTIMSSALDKCLDIVYKRYHPSAWNIYTFHCSDGDNWPSDINKAIDLSNKLKNICQMYCYIQIAPFKRNLELWSDGGMTKHYLPHSDKKFKLVQIDNKDDIWPEFKRIFGGN